MKLIRLALLLTLATNVRGMRPQASSQAIRLSCRPSRMRIQRMAYEMNVCSSGGDGNQEASGSALALQWQRLELERLTSNAGLSERERRRFSYLIKTHEPIPQEIVGLQAICGYVGSRYAGFCGLLIGVLQAGPLFSIIPGRSGNFLRGSGWWVYACVATVVKRLCSLAREMRRWCDATGTSQAANVALHSSRGLLHVLRGAANGGMGESRDARQQQQ